MEKNFAALKPHPRLCQAHLTPLSRAPQYALALSNIKKMEKKIGKKFCRPQAAPPAMPRPPNTPVMHPRYALALMNKKGYEKKLKQIFAALKPHPRPCHAPFTRPWYALALLNLRNLKKKK